MGATGCSVHNPFAIFTDSVHPMPIPSRWSPKYELGIPPIDQQHQSIFQLLDDLNGVLTRQDKDSMSFHLTLSLVRQWADRHFSSEETLMAVIEFPDIQEHKYLHHEFLRKMEEASFLIRQNGDFLAAVERLIDYIATWLDGHILVEDQEWAAYLKAHFVRRGSS